MRDEQGVACMVAEILTRRAKARAPRTADSFEDALEVVLGTEASRRLRELGSSAPSREGGRVAGERRPGAGRGARLALASRDPGPIGRLTVEAEEGGRDR